MHPDISFACAGGGGPMDIPHGIAGMIGADAPNQEGILQELLPPDKLAELGLIK